MTILRKVFIALFVAVLTSCASVSTAPDQQSNEAKEFSVSDDRGAVYLYRPGRAVGAAVQLMVKVNGVDAGGTGPGSFFKWDLSPGMYTFMSSTTESSASVQLEVSAGEIYFIRQDARLGLSSGRVTMTQVDRAQGVREIGSSQLLISSFIPE